MWNVLLNKIFYNLETVQFFGFIIALMISYLITPYIQSRARKLGFLDKPSERKIHKIPVPRLGGVSVYISFFLTTLFFITVYWKYHSLLTGTFTLMGIFAGGTIIFILGLFDDIEPLPALLKFLIQILAASVAWFLGVKILQVVNPLYHANFYFFEFSIGDETIYFSHLVSFLLTLIWIVGITNAINLIDGMDGLATGISLISAIAIWAVSVDYRINQPAGALMAATLAGSLLGFLRWNFNPARIFLGDSGAYLTGFVLSSLAVSCVVKKVALSIMTPAFILIFALPIMDTTFAILRRTFTGKSVFKPDKEHLYHRVLAVGLSQKITSYLLYFVSGSLGLLATYLISFKSTLRYVFLSTIVMSIALFYTFVINWRRQKPFRNLFNNPQHRIHLD
ncbi:MAG: undecaprenyl/decaprenyl-phosphate alpha-N-acetylglucosaminyl 1-phosphate transferase [Candidatus Melainabacteria bacterium]|nr:undecaprenyl/decaprenyl-phosphate alpha-N-acetylglucosaminyl 1-phosphate transferase [Candidatus Melainabacteria bacterium]